MVCFCLPRLYTLHFYINMRKITQQAVEAMFSRKKFKKSNTEILVDGDYSAMFLHGNKIAEIDKQELFICSRGWKTNTTKERLNGALGQLFGYYGYIPKIVQKDFEWFIEIYQPSTLTKETNRIYEDYVFHWDGSKINVKRWIKDEVKKQYYHSLD